MARRSASARLLLDFGALVTGTFVGGLIEGFLTVENLPLDPGRTEGLTPGLTLGLVLGLMLGREVGCTLGR